jgi:hypothetical protein
MTDFLREEALHGCVLGLLVAIGTGRIDFWNLGHLIVFEED